VTVHLLDTNVLIALAWPQHIHHAPAHRWFANNRRQAWATCPITQLGFIRISSNPQIIREAVTPREALALLNQIIALPGHQFWSDDLLPTAAAPLSSLALVGHRQVTDAYLLALAQHQKGRLATFDRGIAELISAPKNRYLHVTLIR